MQGLRAEQRIAVSAVASLVKFINSQPLELARGLVIYEFDSALHAHYTQFIPKMQLLLIKSLNDRLLRPSLVFPSF